MHLDTNNAFVITTSSEPVYADVEQINYDTSIHALEEKQTLYIYDLPANLAQLKAIIKQTKPVNIVACYHIEDSAYLSAFPSREEFVWFYALVRKRKVLDLKTELQTIMNHKGWSKDRIIFISNVFFELGFVKIENGVIELETNPEKKDLSDSKLYQERLNRADIEKQLYYSNYEELKMWMESCMDYLNIPEEEVVNGL